MGGWGGAGVGFAERGGEEAASEVRWQMGHNGRETEGGVDEKARERREENL